MRAGPALIGTDSPCSLSNGAGCCRHRAISVSFLALNGSLVGPWGRPIGPLFRRQNGDGWAEAWQPESREARVWNCFGCIRSEVEAHRFTSDLDCTSDGRTLRRKGHQTACLSRIRLTLILLCAGAPPGPRILSLSQPSSCQSAHKSRAEPAPFSRENRSRLGAETASPRRLDGSLSIAHSRCVGARCDPRHR